MRRDILGKLQCIGCGGREFDVVVTQQDDLEIRGGHVHCLDCRTEYPIRQGIVDMLDHEDEAIRDEQAGWDSFANAEGWADAPKSYYLELPRPSQRIEGDTLHWDTHADNFNRLLDHLDLEGANVLDLGAGRCWSTKHYAKRDARCVAVDVVTTPGIGLGTADLLMEHEGVYFDRMLADMNHLPFADESFDMVLFAASLHHTTDLERTIQEVYRVLRHKGTLGMTNEACGGYFSFETAGCTEAQEGIHEHNYRFSRYSKAMRQCGFDTPTLISDTDFSQGTGLGKHRLLNPVFSRLPRTIDALRWKMRLFGGVLILTARKD